MTLLEDDLDFFVLSQTSNLSQGPSLAEVLSRAYKSQSSLRRRSNAFLAQFFYLKKYWCKCFQTFLLSAQRLRKLWSTPVRILAFMSWLSCETYAFNPHLYFVPILFVELRRRKLILVISPLVRRTTWNSTLALGKRILDNEAKRTRPLPMPCSWTKIITK